MKKLKKVKKHDKRSYFDSIPVDVVINIISKLPLKSKALCRCVSQQWSSIIRSPNYNLLFPIKSQPRFLFALEVDKNSLYYSSPQPQNPDENSSVVATLHLSKPSQDYYALYLPVRGLICRRHFDRSINSVVMVSNPITGEYVTLPALPVRQIKRKHEGRFEKYIFGYDPIDKQFKVLAITWLDYVSRHYSVKFETLTLGTGNLSWREIYSCIKHYPLSEDNDKGICINGVLYYLATVTNYSNPTDHPPESGTVCFNVRTEEFSFIRVDQDMINVFRKHRSPINCRNKFGVLIYDYNAFHLWVLEDANKQKWSKHIYQMSLPSLHSESLYLRTAGMISSGEIVFYERFARDPFVVYYYNLEKKTITSVRIEFPGLKEFKDTKFHTFSNFVEDLKFM